MGDSISEKEPLVSIVIPVYNGSDYLREAIDSALAQTYRNLEVLVVNDGSTDDGATGRIAESYGDKIRYFEKPNGGVSSALNLGIQKMNGDYFSWLSHDDTYGPHKIEHQIDLLNRYGDDKSIAMCCADYINSESEEIRKAAKRDAEDGTLWSGKESLLRLFRSGSYIGCNMLIPRKAFEDCGVFDEDFRYVQDTLMWIRLFVNGYGLLISNTVDVHNRIHDKQLTQTGRELFDSESIEMNRLVLPSLLQLSDKEYPLLYEYASFNATYRHAEIVAECIEKGRANGKLSVFQVIRLRQRLLYGEIRPTIRKVYYRLFYKVKTG